MRSKNILLIYSTFSFGVPVRKTGGVKEFKDGIGEDGEKKGDTDKEETKTNK